MGGDPLVEALREKVAKNGTISVFFSSPFSGMEEEREAMVKKYMPQLRGMCEPRGVFIKLVDLRWGVTSEQAEQNLTMQICLKEIDRCDLFLGTYGRRYGTVDSNEAGQHWVAENFDIAAGKYPWVQQWRDRSITELEYRHGCLNDPSLRHALFYFRDHGYDEGKAKQHSKNSVLRDKYTNPSELHAEKLASLKAEVVAVSRDSPYIDCFDYKDPEEAALKMFQSLRDLVQQVLPDKVAAKMDEQTQTHHAFAACRRRLYVGGEMLVKRIEDHVASTSSPLVIEGESGSGKSSLLANWISAHEKANPGDRVFYHFTGCDSASTRLRNLLSRIVLFATSDKERVDATSTEVLVARLPNLLSEIAGSLPSGSRLIVVLDAINQLENEAMGWLPGRYVHRLGWLPVKYHPKVVLICSSLPGEAIDTLRARNYTFQSTVPLTIADRREFSKAMLGSVSKALTEAQMVALLKSPATSNPLFLTLLLEELIAFGEFEKVFDKMNELSACQNVPELLVAVLQRIEATFQKAAVDDVVAKTFQAIGASSSGIMEHEIANVLGVGSGASCPALLWSQVFFAIKHLLVEKSGRLTFLHDYIRQAVDDRYLGSEKKQHQAHDRLAQYYVAQPLRFNSEVNYRKVDEELEHLRLAGHAVASLRTLCNLEHLEAKCEVGLLFEIVEDFRETNRLFRVASKEAGKDALHDATSITPEMWQQFDDYRHMVTLQVFYLSKLPKRMLQVAANEPDVTACAPAAQALLAARKQPWIRVRNKAEQRSAATIHYDGHKGSVYAVAAHSSGLVASGARSGAVRIWSLITAEQMYSFQGHSTHVRDVLFLDESTVLSADDSGVIAVWDLKSGSQKSSLELDGEGKGGAVMSIAISPKTGRFLTAHNRDGQGAIVVWHTVSLTIEHVTKLQGIPYCVCFSPDGATFVVDLDSVDHQTVLEYSLSPDGDAPTLISSTAVGTPGDSQSGARELTCRLRSISFSPEGERFVVVHPREHALSIYVRGVHGWTKDLALADGHTDAVFSCAWSPAGDTILSGGRDKLVVVWDPATGKPLRKLVGHAWTVFSVGYAFEDGLPKLCVSGAGIWDKRVLVWDLDIAAANKNTIPPHAREIVMGGAYSPSYRYFLSAGQNGPSTVVAWEAENMDNLGTVDLFKDCRGYGLAISPNDEYAFMGPSGQLVTVDMDGFGVARGVLPNAASSGDVLVSPCGRFVITAGRSIKTYDIETGELISNITNGGRVHAVSPSGKRVVVAESSAGIVWQIQPPKKLGFLKHRSSGKLYGVAFSPCGRWIGTASPDKSVHVWSAKNYEIVSRCEMWDRAYRLCFSSDSLYVICGGDDKTVGVWEASTGVECGRVYVGAGVGTVSTGPHGTHIMAGDDLGRVVALEMRNFDLEAPFVTPAWIWSAKKHLWSDQAQLKCPYTGQFFACPAEVLARVEELSAVARPADCPATQVAAAAFEDPLLCVTSPFVSEGRNTMRVTPFLVDSRHNDAKGVAGLHDYRLAMKKAEELLLVRRDPIFCVKQEGEGDAQYSWVRGSSIVLNKSLAQFKKERKENTPEPEVGLKVVAKHPSYQPYWNASIVEIQADGRLSLKFDDGDACVQSPEQVLPVLHPEQKDGVMGSNVYVCIGDDGSRVKPFVPAVLVACLPATEEQEDSKQGGKGKKSKPKQRSGTAASVAAAEAVEVEVPRVQVQQASTCCTLM